MNPPADLPRLLVFSEGAISRLHGTGTIFERNFAAYPPDRLSNWFLGAAEEPLVARHRDLNPHRWPVRGWWPPAVALAKLWNRSARPLGARRWAVPVNRAALRAAAAGPGENFDLVYGIVFSRAGIDALAAVLAGLGPRVPLVLQVQDFYPRAELGFWAALRRLAPRITEVWAVSESIARDFRSRLGRPVRVDPLLHLAVPAVSKSGHRTFGPDFRAVVLGNFWQWGLLRDLRAVWRTCQEQLPGLPPVRWHCHPDGVARLRGAGFEPLPEVEPAPFLTGDALFAMLRDADLALIPFSRGRKPATDYERYSMPSRLTEICAAGLPVFGLTGAATPLADYLAEHRIGRFAPAADRRGAASGLAAMIRDRELRAACGQAARMLAEREYPLAPFQSWLYGRLGELAAAGAGR